LNTEHAPVEHFDMRLRQRLLDLVANPNVAYLLMMDGLLGLYVEFTNPGVVFPGVAGAICLLLAMAALQVLPINYTGLALIGLGVSMLVAEAFLPSFGVIGVGGLVAFVLGSLLLFDTPDSTVQVDRWCLLSSSSHRSPPARIGTWASVRRATRTLRTGRPSIAWSVIAFSGIRLPPRSPSLAVITTSHAASMIRSLSDSAEKPPNTTLCTAPIRAHESMA
jgi:membrane-bound ClpP family serine protease